jgi:hypothetical protein
MRGFKVFHGTKLAQSSLANIEFIDIFTGSAGAHNLKVVGSNPTPATKVLFIINCLDGGSSSSSLPKVGDTEAAQ